MLPKKKYKYEYSAVINEEIRNLSLKLKKTLNFKI